MSNRVHNFNPGPAALPDEVLEKVQDELFDYQGTGMSVMELSHRSSHFEEIISSAESLMLEVCNLDPGEYQVLFLQGGASLQFSMLPLNFLPEGNIADYIITGSFAQKSLKEAQKIGKTHIAASTEDGGFCSIPTPEEINYSSSPAYVHITSNNTIFGTQWQSYPETGDTPLIADMSSDILSRDIDMSRFSLVYAGAQKNLGPAGVTAVILKKELLERVPDNLPDMLSYKTHAEAGSLHNTPSCFPVYVLKLMLEWIKNRGGIKEQEKINRQKADMIYQVIDDNKEFYRGHARKEDRSIMNITFRLPDEKLEKTFLEEAQKEGMTGLKGHRSVGGIRASLYNAVTLKSCETLASFMQEFCRRKG